MNKYMHIVYTLCICMCVHTEITGGLSKAGKALNPCSRGKDAGHCLRGACSQGAAHGLIA